MENLIERKKAAKLMHALDSSKSESQWYHFLNDNAKSSVQPKKKIPYIISTNRIAMYEVNNIKKYIESRARKINTSRSKEIESAFGVLKKENINSFGQAFGYVWEGAAVNIILDNREKGEDAVSIQLQINNPLRVSALTISQAESLVAELIEKIDQAKNLAL